MLPAGELPTGFEMNTSRITSRVPAFHDKIGDYESINGATPDDDMADCYQLLLKNGETGETFPHRMCVPLELLPRCDDGSRRDYKSAMADKWKQRLEAMQNANTDEDRQRVMDELSLQNKMAEERKQDHQARFRDALKERVGVLIAKVATTPSDPDSAEFEKLAEQMIKAGVPEDEVITARAALHTYTEKEIEVGFDDDSRRLMQLWDQCKEEMSAGDKMPADFKAAMDKMPAAQKALFMKVIDDLTKSGSDGKITDDQIDKMQTIAQGLACVPDHLVAAMPIRAELKTECKANSQAALDRLKCGEDVDDVVPPLPCTVENDWDDEDTARLKFRAVGMAVAFEQAMVEKSKSMQLPKTLNEALVESVQEAHRNQLADVLSLAKKINNPNQTPTPDDVRRFLVAWWRNGSDKSSSTQHLFCDITSWAERTLGKTVVRKAQNGKFNQGLTLARKLEGALTKARRDADQKFHVTERKEEQKAKAKTAAPSATRALPADAHPKIKKINEWLDKNPKYKPRLEIARQAVEVRSDRTVSIGDAICEMSKGMPAQDARSLHVACGGILLPADAPIPEEYKDTEYVPPVSTLPCSEEEDCVADEQIRREYAEALVNQMTSSDLKAMAERSGVTIADDVKDKMDEWERLGISKDRPIIKSMAERSGVTIADDVKDKMDASEREYLPHPLTEGEKDCMILAEKQGSEAWNEVVTAIKECRFGKYPPDWKNLILDRGLWKETASKSAAPSASETTFKGLKGGFFKSSKSESKKPMVCKPDGYLDCVDSNLGKSIFNPPVATYTMRQEIAYQQLSIAPEEVLLKLKNGKPEDIVCIAEHTGLQVDDIMSARQRIQIYYDPSLTDEERVYYMSMYNGSKADPSEPPPERVCHTVEYGSDSSEDEDEHEAHTNQSALDFITNTSHDDFCKFAASHGLCSNPNAPVYAKTTRHIKAGEQIQLGDLAPFKLTKNPDGSFLSVRPANTRGMEVMEVSDKGIRSMGCNCAATTAEQLAVEAAYNNAVKAFGPWIMSKLEIIISSNESHKLKWVHLAIYSFEPITMDGKSCLISADTTNFTSWKPPEAIRHLEIKEFVMPVNSAERRKDYPVLPVVPTKREFLERCMVAGAKAEDAWIERKLREKERAQAEKRLQREFEELKANDVANDLREAEEERSAREAFKQSEVYKEEQRVKNLRAKEREKAGKAGKAAALKEKEVEKARKAAADKLAAKQMQADECILNGIKYGQQLWDAGDRKAARERLGVANKKHFANASDDAQQRSRLKRAMWDTIEDSERVAPTPAPEPTLEQQLAIIAEDTPDVSPEPSAPRETNSQRKARKKREKRFREIYLKFRLEHSLTNYVVRFRARKDAEREQAQRQAEIAEQQLILDEIRSRDRTERTNQVGKGKGRGGRGGRGIGEGRGGSSSRNRGHAFRLTPVRTCNVNGVASSSDPLPPPVDDDDTCIICLDRARTHTTVPCGHLKFCGECAAKMTKEGRQRCPECNITLNPAQKFMKVFTK